MLTTESRIQPIGSCVYLRIHIKMLNRKTIGYSKSKEIHDKVTMFD
ncbi:IS1 family transposase [Xenorhabdus griffiniae]|nr:hypothetical protein [Xenorhabdus griffiniae]MBE8589284.1 hypothetical protein [Xenorhabdus griffiniae]